MAGPHDTIGLAAARLRAGGVVAFPTETVYGLGALATDEGAVRRVYELKGRPAANPLIVHVSGIPMARTVAAQWPDEADVLARAFWPGPLTIVVARAPTIPAVVSAGAGSVGVRCPDHPLTLALIAALGSPIVGPSANRSGRVSPTTADHVRAEFSADEVVVLDGGPCRAGIESTVVALVDAEGSPCKPRILRPGAIGSEALAGVLGAPVGLVGAAPVGPLQSPGMLDRHYAPVTRAILRNTAEIPSLLAQSTERCVVLADAGVPVPPPHTFIVMPTDAPAYAARLYAALREADASGAQTIIIANPATSTQDAALWNAVSDRLRRATAG